MKTDPIGCVVLLLLGFIAIVVLLTFSINHPLSSLWITLAIIGFIILILVKRKAKQRKKEQEFLQAVASQMEKWQDWEQNGVPSISNKDLLLKETETLLYSFPYTLKVGASYRLHRGVLHITNSRFLFMSDTTLKDVAFDNVLSVNATHEILCITSRKKGLLLNLTPNTDKPDVMRLQLADAYAIWFLLNRGKYADMEQRVLTILGVKKQ